ncbi:MAG: hypothetical protein ACYC61_14190 [Isosphaeraceae bacterium]
MIGMAPGQGLALAGPATTVSRSQIGAKAFRPRRPDILLGLVVATLMVSLVPAVAGTGVRREPPPSDATQAANWSIPGLVVDAAGKPVAGASVRVIGRSGEPAEVVSGPDGKFVVRVSGSMEDRARLVATADDGRLQGLGTFVESKDSAVPSAPARITLAPGRSVEVTVKDGKANPVPDARVEVLSNGQPLASSPTDATGRAVVHYPADSRVNAVLAFRPSTGLDDFENDRSNPPIGDPPPLPGSISLTLDGARTVRVRAVDAGGRPVAGVVLHPQWVKRPSKLGSVRLKSSRWTGARTDRDGIATFDWLPVDLEGGCPIVADGGAYSIPSFYNTPSRDASAVKTIRLIRNVPLRGRVIHADGRPAAGILIRASGTTLADSDRVVGAGGLARTAADGAYAILVPARHTFIVGVDDRNVAARSLTGIEVGDNGPSGVPDLTLIRGTVIRGRFRLGPEGKPVPGHPILLDELGPVLFQGEDGPRGIQMILARHVSTDSEGRFAFRVGPGEYRVKIIQDEQIDVFERTVKDEEAMDLDLHLARGGTRLTGQVIDRRGGTSRSVPGAVVMTLEDEEMWSARARADAYGRFAMVGPALAAFHSGGKTLYARSPDGAIAGFATLRPDSSEVTIELRTAARVAGQVLDDAGRPVPGRVVALRLWQGKGDGDVPGVLRMPGFLSVPELRFEATTDAEGRYRFLGLPPGTNGRVSLDIGESDPGVDGTTTRGFQVEGRSAFTLPDLIAPRPRKPGVDPE